MKSNLTRAALFLALVSPTLAEEGGASRYVPGNAATLIDLPPTKVPELETRRRLEGDFFWLKLVYQF